MIDRQQQALRALSQDLYRVAMGRHRGQLVMAARFAEEARARLDELTEFNLKDKVLASLDSTAERSAEDLLMYSTIVRNHTL